MSTKVQQRMSFTEIVRLLKESKADVIGLDGGQFEATITIQTTDVHRHRFYCHVKGAQLLRCRQLARDYGTIEVRPVDPRVVNINGEDVIARRMPVEDY